MMKMHVILVERDIKVFQTRGLVMEDFEMHRIDPIHIQKSPSMHLRATILLSNHKSPCCMHLKAKILLSNHTTYPCVSQNTACISLPDISPPSSFTLPSFSWANINSFRIFGKIISYNSFLFTPFMYLVTTLLCNNTIINLLISCCDVLGCV